MICCDALQHAVRVNEPGMSKVHEVTKKARCHLPDLLAPTRLVVVAPIAVLCSLSADIGQA